MRDEREREREKGTYSRGAKEGWGICVCVRGGGGGWLLDSMRVSRGLVEHCDRSCVDAYLV